MRFIGPFLFLILISCSACRTSTNSIKPNISYTAPPYLIETLPSPFASLSPKERATGWGKELYIGQKLGREQDLFRAVTAFKRARILLPENGSPTRKMQIEYSLLLAYYLGNKYETVIENFEKSTLQVRPEDFPAYNELLLVLYDSYMKRADLGRANSILTFMKKHSPELAKKMTLYQKISSGEYDDAELSEIRKIFDANRKSPERARWLNGLLPGAGYLYIGQKQTALTSFLINAVFIAATYQLFHHGQTAAAIITAGFEVGWYVGGIHGAGLAAEQYNNTLYSRLAKSEMSEQKLFPVLMFQYSF